MDQQSPGFLVANMGSSLWGMPYAWYYNTDWWLTEDIFPTRWNCLDPELSTRIRLQYSNEILLFCLEDVACLHSIIWGTALSILQFTQFQHISWSCRYSQIFQSDQPSKVLNLLKQYTNVVPSTKYPEVKFNKLMTWATWQMPLAEAFYLLLFLICCNFLKKRTRSLWKKANRT